jgi:hypothetical protein
VVSRPDDWNETPPTRAGWEWCAACGGIKPPGHAHDALDALTREQLVAEIRRLRALLDAGGL